MSLPYLYSEKGATLAELVVAMALVSILLLAVVSGSLFFKRTLASWKERDSLAEELACVHGELTSAIQSGQRLELRDSSLMIQVPGKEGILYLWTGGLFKKNGKPILRKKVTVEALSIEAVVLPELAVDTILNGNQVLPASGIYQVNITLADDRGLRDSLKCLVVNRYEKDKYRDN